MESDSDEWWRDVEVNIRSVFLCSHAVLKSMPQRKHERILNFTSSGMPKVSAYDCSKVAITIGLTHTEMMDYMIESEAGKKWLPDLGNMMEGRWQPVEMACGTGQNLPLFARNSKITAVDLSPKMLELAHANAIKHNLNVNLAVMDAENLEFADGSFDTVVSTLSTCTFPNPVKALQEIKRVCRPDGLIPLLEHGHSNLPWLANYQDRNEYQHYQGHAGCRWNQDPLDLVQSAGIKVLKNKRNILGMFHSIEAMPASLT